MFGKNHNLCIINDKKIIESIKTCGYAIMDRNIFYNECFFIESK